MLDVIEKLLVLQDRDRRILRTRAEVSRIEPERAMLQAKASGTAAALEAAKLNVRQLESDRKKLELDVEAKKQLIERYALQQFQTKKNEEYRALAHEIDTCKEAIVGIEDQQLELMEQAETAQKQVVAAAREADEARRAVEGQLKELAVREQNLNAELARLESDRDQLASAIEDGVLNRYQRLLKNKGDNVIVGIQHGVCGGCHMKLSPQVVVTCQGGQELVTCQNCNRILYYSQEMDLALVD